MEVREPVVAGYFYEGEKKLLLEQIKSCFLHKLGPGKLPEIKTGKRKIIGLVVPHAGYFYSGAIAAHAYHALASDGNPQTFILLGPNHTGIGMPISAIKNGRWLTPLGELTVDSALAEKLIDNKIVLEDPVAHSSEHSIEVQLPFLQFVYKKVKFVPICMLDQSFEACTRLANMIVKAAKNKDAVIIASSDFSHYEAYETAYAKDAKAIDALNALDARRFYERVLSLDISICGYGPITTMMIVAKAVGAKSCEILKYATSGDVTGDKHEVVGYCAAMVKK